MINTEIQLDKFTLKRAESALRGIPNALPKAVSRGINKTTAHARSVTVKEITKMINQGRKGKARLRQKDVRSRVWYKRATARDWTGIMTLLGRGLSLAVYGAVQTETGAEYTGADSGTVEIPHAFIPQLKSDYQGIFMRVGKSRLPLTEQYGHSLADMWNEAPALASSVMQDANKNLHKNIMTQVQLLVDKFNQKRKVA